MMEFPRHLHPIHTFEHDGKRYAADFETGLVAAIDEIMALILEHCQRYTTTQLIQHLEKIYERPAIWASFERLEQMATVGMFFGDKSIPIEMDPSKFNLFLCPGFLTSIGQSRFTTKLEKYYLLHALTRQTGVFAGLDPTPKELHAEEIDFEAAGVRKVSIPRNWTYAGAKYIPDDCLGICSFSPDLDAISFLYYDFRPLVNRVCCSEVTNEAILQSCLVKCALFSLGNALCVDASWLKQHLESQLPEGGLVDGGPICVIPNGVNHALFTPLDKMDCKSNLASAIGNAFFSEKPLVLIFSAGRLDESFVFKLALVNPEIAFLLIDSPLERPDLQIGKPENLEFYPVEEAKDFDALSVVFNAGDLGFFPATVGVASTHIFSAMACGVPMVVAGDEMPEEVGSAGVFLRFRRDSLGNIEVPVQLLSEKLKFLFSHPDHLSFLGASAVKRVERWTWDAVATQFLELYRELARQKASVKPKQSRHPIGFWQVYNPEDGTVESQAVELATFRRYPVEEALALTLLTEHTPQEVMTVFSHVLQNEQKAREILNRAIVLSESRRL